MKTFIKHEVILLCLLARIIGISFACDGYCVDDVCDEKQYCTKGCQDGYWGYRCKNMCKVNCLQCDGKEGSGNLCFACKSSYYDKEHFCNKSCSIGCIRGQCQNDGTCECTENHKGDKCDTCIQGKFGTNCTSSCHYPKCFCNNEYGCEECAIGHYDYNTNCAKECSIGCVGNKCFNDGRCSCRYHFKGGNCVDCVDGYFDDNCNSTCSLGCKNNICAKNGTCECTEHFSGVMCKNCIIGRFGETCEHECSNGCLNKSCDRSNGYCICRNSFKGLKCDQCNDGFYGDNCSLPCSENCASNSCSKDDGSCKYGCKIGFTSADCSQTCNLSCKTCLQNDALYCQSCSDGYSGQKCACPPNCRCDTQENVCSSCENEYIKPLTGCTCHRKFCANGICPTCVNNTYFSDGNVCCQCSKKCKDNACLTSNQCLSCPDGFHGDDCTETCLHFDNYCSICKQKERECVICKDGYFPDYSGRCQPCSENCVNQVCFPNNGSCSKGCKDGFRDKNCDKACSDNCTSCDRDNEMCNACKNNVTYGPFCNIACGPTCLEGKCGIESGECFKGCIKHFYGLQCETECPASCKQEDDSTRCDPSGNCVNGCIDGFEGSDCTSSKMEAVKSGPQVGTIAGGVSGGIVVIIGVVISILFLRRRSVRSTASGKIKRNVDTTSHTNNTEANETSANERIYYNEDQIKRESTQQKPTVTRPPAHKPTSAKLQVSAHVMTASENEIQLEIDEESNGVLDNSSKSDQTYQNEFVSSTSKSKVPIGHLDIYVNGRTHEELSEEFQKFPCGLVKPYVDSQKRENMSKNRYKGIYPYDDSRVQVAGSGGSDYINASFIDGYKKPKQYIATLGPMSQQLDDFSLFWKMIWQQRVEKIVMVTNLIEHGSPKCEQYWPNPGVSKTYGEIKVESRSENEYAEFTRRALTMTMGTEERMLHHLHFTCWPDKAIPDDVTAMIEFRQRVQSTPNTLNGPTVVHCSAGVGRTGTYIALDILTKEGEAERAIDIAGCVHKMRQNRPNMVQTVEQYQFLHTAVVYSLTFDCKQIKGENFDQFMKQHTSKELNSQFKRLQHTVEKRTKDEAIAVERNKQHLSKNRANADIPGNENRPRLYLNLKHGAADYINAVYIHSFRIKKRYLVAQTPLPETVIDFLTLVVQESCSCIVSFEADMDKQRNIGIYYPAANQEVLKQGTFQVSCSREEKKTFYAERTLTIQHKGVGTSTQRTIPHLQFTDWDETNNIPRSTTNFLSFLNVIENVTKQSGDGPILVHCLDGAGKSGLFCVVSLLLHKMAVEHEVSVLNSVRKVKTMRRLAIPNQEQFSFCHGCVSEYLSSFDVYANFNEETGRL